MSKINILDINVANMIAAGEVIERPAAVVKELIENSIDAGADLITIEIQRGGISYIRVSDNGIGMSCEDAPVAFLRHATSKIKSADDLDAIYTLGFRGEALAAIAAVSKIELNTKMRDSEFGTKVVISEGNIIEVSDTGCAEGTTIVIRDLFYNTPARMKFLKKDSTEAGYITDIINKMVLCNPHISFKYINNGKEMFFTPGDNNLHNAIYTVYGKDYPKHMIELNGDSDYIKVNGMIGKSEIARPNRNMQSFFINGRYVKSKMLTVALDEAYKGQLMVGKFPVCVIYLSISAENIDVNVHPTKMEVKFSDEKAVYSAVYRAVKNALYGMDNRKYFEDLIAPKTESPENIDEANEKIDEITVHNAKKGEPDTIAPPIKTLEFLPEHKKEEVKQVFFDTKASNHFRVREDRAEFKADTDNTEIENAQSETKELFVEKESKWNVIGQAFNTYIIAERGDELIFVDQHAAHERIVFEQLLRAYRNKDCMAQMIMVPEIVDLSHVEFDIFIDNQKFFEEIGFEFDIFGNNSIIVRSAPMDIAYDRIKGLVIEIADMISGTKKGTVVVDTVEQALHMVACRSAIKANRAMGAYEMESLLSAVFLLDNINTCPHGRPIVLTMDKKYIEKQFKRLL